jgi:hypothetical protein
LSHAWRTENQYEARCTKCDLVAKTIELDLAGPCNMATPSSIWICPTCIGGPSPDYTDCAVCAINELKTENAALKQLLDTIGYTAGKAANDLTAIRKKLDDK